MDCYLWIHDLSYQGIYIISIDFGCFYLVICRNQQINYRQNFEGVFSFFTLSISMLVGVLMLNYFTSQEVSSAIQTGYFDG